MKKEEFTIPHLIGVLLLVPHALFTLGALLNMALTLLVIENNMQKLLFDGLIGAIELTGGVVTCIALWKPGKFTSYGPLARIRILAVAWNCLNLAWLGFILSKFGFAPDVIPLGALSITIGQMQASKFVLAVLTATALMWFARKERA